MALPYKLIKSLTIDGETMGLDENWGGIQSNRKDIALPANTETEGATLTITEPGLYMFCGRVTFAGASTTGTRSCEVLLKQKTNGQSSYSSMINQRIPNISSVQTVLEVSRMALFGASQVPATVSIFAFSSVASPSGYTGLYCSKLVDMGV